MQLKLLSSVCVVALGLAFAPGAWAYDEPSVDDGSAVAIEGNATASNTETETTADDQSLNESSAVAGDDQNSADNSSNQAGDDQAVGTDSNMAGDDQAVADNGSSQAGYDQAISSNQAGDDQQVATGSNQSGDDQ